METEKKLRILMLEDNPEDAFLIEHVLRKDNMVFAAERVDSRDEFLESIQRFKPDVVLSDHGLPQFNAREALRICLKYQASTPFILVTGTMNDETAISTLREGADDYILKGNLTRLPSAIRRALKSRRVEQLKREARYALRAQNKELMKVNNELDKFVYSVSHNLRGPLASILGLLNVAETRQGNIAEVHALIRKSVLKLDDTVREILDYSNNARTEISRSEVDWQTLMRGTIDQLQYLPNASVVNTKFDDNDARFPFYSDPGRLALIFNAVYSNSILYSDFRKTPLIESKVTVSYDTATIRITDNGIGISEQYLPNVFDMFYRATEKSAGPGLGLYIAREAVKKLNGKIEIESRENEGTSLVITIPNNQVPAI